MTRASTPKWQIETDMGVVILSGISKTEAIKIAIQMNKGMKSKVYVVPVKKKVEDSAS